MFWLFGQIWLWLLVAFTLGAALTGFLLTTAARKRAPEPAPAIDDEEPDTSYEIQRGDLGLSEETLSGNEIPPQKERHEARRDAPPRWPGEPEWPPAEQESPSASDRFMY
jgi:hypothetical protein